MNVHRVEEALAGRPVEHDRRNVVHPGDVAQHEDSETHEARVAEQPLEAVGDDQYKVIDESGYGVASNCNWGWNNCTIQREEYLENRTALDDKYESIKDAFNNNIKEDHVYDGFNFDSSNVSTQFAAVEAAIDNYYNPLINGLVDDVDASIDAMNAAMDSAGIQDILDEMNRQAAEYVAEKEGKKNSKIKQGMDALVCQKLRRGRSFF